MVKVTSGTTKFGDQIEGTSSETTLTASLVYVSDGVEEESEREGDGWSQWWYSIVVCNGDKLG